VLLNSSPDRQVLGATAHAIISLAGNFGFERLSALARSVEEACSGIDGVPSEELMASFRAALTEARSRVESLDPMYAKMMLERI